MSKVQEILGELKDTQQRLESIIKDEIAGREDLTIADRNEAIRWVHLIENGKKKRMEVGG